MRQVPKIHPPVPHIAHFLSHFCKLPVSFCRFLFDYFMNHSQYLYPFVSHYSLYLPLCHFFHSVTCFLFLTVHNVALKCVFHYLVFYICWVSFFLWISQFRLLVSCMAFSWFLNWQDSRLCHYRETVILFLQTKCTLYPQSLALALSINIFWMPTWVKL